MQAILGILIMFICICVVDKNNNKEDSPLWISAVGLIGIVFGMGILGMAIL